MSIGRKEGEKKRDQCLCVLVCTYSFSRSFIQSFILVIIVFCTGLAHIPFLNGRQISEDAIHANLRKHSLRSHKSTFSSKKKKYM